jgi:hypothetical protein
MGIKISKVSSPVTRGSVAYGFSDMRKHVVMGIKGCPYVLMIGWSPIVK